MKTDLFREQAMWKHPPVSEMNTQMKFDQSEKQVLRALAEKVSEIAARDSMQEKIERWTRHNDLLSDEPVVFVDPENGWNEIFTDNIMQCRDPLARTWENILRKRIYSAEVIKDDTVVTDDFDVPFVYYDSGWGFEMIKTGGENGGAYHIEPAIVDYEEDFAKLKFPQITIDYEKSERLMECAQEVFGDILKVRRYQNWHWATDYVDQFVYLRGMEDFMCDFVMNPEWLQKVLDLITEGMMRRLDWMEANQLLFVNNDYNYVGTGGQGYTKQLPAKDFHGQVRTKDMWCGLQAQETVSVNPDMFGEFMLPNYKKIAERFGLVCYGCCEPYDPRWKYVKQIPNLRRVSVSPWAKFSTVPEYLGKDYVASVKLKPTPLASEHMNEEYVRRECKRAVEETYGGICEFIMKDNHTIGNNPNNLIRWTEIMREEIEKVYG